MDLNAAQMFDLRVSASELKVILKGLTHKLPTEGALNDEAAALATAIAKRRVDVLEQHLKAARGAQDSIAQEGK